MKKNDPRDPSGLFSAVRQGNEVHIQNMTKGNYFQSGALTVRPPA
ncbi:MAG: hypothetical protein ACOC4C_02930 [Fibrobacterota bacterium]